MILTKFVKKSLCKIVYLLTTDVNGFIGGYTQWFVPQIPSRMTAERSAPSRPLV